MDCKFLSLKFRAILTCTMLDCTIFKVTVIFTVFCTIAGPNFRNTALQTETVMPNVYIWETFYHGLMEYWKVQENRSQAGALYLLLLREQEHVVILACSSTAIDLWGWVMLISSFLRSHSTLSRHQPYAFLKVAPSLGIPLYSFLNILLSSILRTWPSYLFRCILI